MRRRMQDWWVARLERRRRWQALLGLLWRAGRGRTVALGLLTVLQGLLPIGVMLATGLLVDAVPGAVREGLNSPAGARVVLAIALVVAAFAAGSVVGALAEYRAKTLDDRYALAVHETVARATLRVRGIAGLEDPTVAGEIAALEEVERADGHLTTVQNLRFVVQYRVTGAAALALLFGLAWWVPFVLLVGWRILNAGFVSWVAHGGELGAAIASTSMRRSRYLRSLAIEPAPAKEIRIFGLADWLVGRYAETWLAAMGDVWRRRRASMREILPPLAALVVAQAAAYGWLGWSAFHGGVSVALVVVYAQAIMNSDGVGVVGDPQWAIGRAAVAARQVKDLEDRLSGGDLEPGGAPARGAAPRGPVGVRFEDVRFTYRARAQPVLDGLDLEIPAGQSLAIVGENGAGKTTLIKLLCGLYDPDAGRIMLTDAQARADTSGVAPSDPAGVGRIGVIFQDFVRYELPLRANVGFGNLALTTDQQALDDALSAAGGGELPDQLPVGWDTVLSGGYDNGQDLSGGQWQKVALARALLAIRGGAGLLVLDEPTAALDVRAETELFDRFLDLTRDVTTILVSHRLASVRHADRIVVIAGGRVCEDGTHDELLASGGRYARMFALQAQRFAAAPNPDGPPQGEEVASDAG
ncbi:ABC transporter ATP-binding protein [Actinopolymorpha sp. B11F2]|uniref:ABC transporter ATP-binding protein n=1 Tax=Actinopolymorpha sp. B11F2 TaxID=3160862 RepID=UPI0032E37FD9